MMAAILYLNYYTKAFQFQQSTWINSFLLQYLIFLIPFAAAYFLQPLFFKNKPFNNSWFWILLFTAPAVFALRNNFSLHHNWFDHLSKDQQLFWIRCSRWLVGFFIVMLPIYFTWKLKDSDKPFYGTQKIKSVKPYLLMIVFMFPLILIACTQPDFLQMYPRANFVYALKLPSQKTHVLLHELFYTLDFITIEFFFRGLLVICMINVCGMHCIIPAACFYCCVHLGKPMAEAVSSFAGGILLGIIAYQTSSVRGGLIVHIGIAWMMEIAGFALTA